MTSQSKVQYPILLLFHNYQLFWIMTIIIII